MGRWIDRAAALALTAFGLYLLFLSAFGSVIAAVCMTFLCCAMLLRLGIKHSGKCRMTRFQARTLLEKWAYGPDDEALAQITALLGSKGCAVIYLPKHPTAAISTNDVFGAWKANRSEASLILCAACPSEGRARTFAASLKNPSVDIMDAPKLIALIRRSDLPAPRTARARQLLIRIRDGLSALVSRRPWHRSMLSGLFLMLLYVITGSALYLLLALSSLLIGGISLRGRT